TRQKILSDRREDIDQHDFLLEHRRPMRHAGSKMQDLARTDDSGRLANREPDAAFLDHRNLLVRMRMNGGVEMRPERQPTDHQLLSDDHLPPDPVGDPLDGHVFPSLRRAGFHRVSGQWHQRGAFPASSPDRPPAAYSGWTFTTPNFRSTSSRCAAIIQRKLIGLPGAATFGWYPSGISTQSS